MVGENVEIQELQPDGSLAFYNTTFSIGMQRYLSKLSSYTTMPLDEFTGYYKDFKSSKVFVSPTI